MRENKSGRDDLYSDEAEQFRVGGHGFRESCDLPVFGLKFQCRRLSLRFSCVMGSLEIR